MYTYTPTDFRAGESSVGPTKMKVLEEEQKNGPKRVQKRIKFEEITEKGEEDRISALPDSLLVEILSRIPFTKAAIRTGILSKRWAHLWTLLPTLTFSYSDLPRSQAVKNPSSYALLVDKTLTQCRQLKLEALEVHVYYDIRFELQFNNWIRYAISCKVEKLYLEFRYPKREPEFQLDQNLFFINSYFTDLRLVGCMLNPSGAISWKNLRSLCISYLNLDQDLILNILSGTPLLETLALKYCCGYTWFQDDESQSQSQSESESEADNAPNTFSLAQCPQLKLKKFTASTNFDIQFEPQLNSWIRYAIRCNVKKLILEFWNTESGYDFMFDQLVFTSSCFSKLRLFGCILNPVGAISWKNLRSLCINSVSLDEDLIENILSGSPVLESLVLDHCCGYKRLDITSKSVKNLVLCGYTSGRENFEADIIEINAPNILSLAIQQNIILWKLLLLNVSSLVEADLNYTGDTRPVWPKETEDEMLKEFITHLGHVKELRIGVQCSKAVSCLQAQGFIFPSNVKFHGYQGGALA